MVYAWPCSMRCLFGEGWTWWACQRRADSQHRLGPRRRFRAVLWPHIYASKAFRALTECAVGPRGARHRASPSQCICPGSISTGFEKAAAMQGAQFLQSSGQALHAKGHCPFALPQDATPAVRLGYAGAFARASRLRHPPRPRIPQLRSAAGFMKPGGDSLGYNFIREPPEINSYNQSECGVVGWGLAGTFQSTVASSLTFPMCLPCPTTKQTGKKPEPCEDGNSLCRW